MNKHLLCEPTIGGECNLCGMVIGPNNFKMNRYIQLLEKNNVSL